MLNACFYAGLALLKLCHVRRLRKPQAAIKRIKFYRPTIHENYFLAQDEHADTTGGPAELTVWRDSRHFEACTRVHAHRA